MGGRATGCSPFLSSSSLQRPLSTQLSALPPAFTPLQLADARLCARFLRPFAGPLGALVNESDPARLLGHVERVVHLMALLWRRGDPRLTARTLDILGGLGACVVRKVGARWAGAV